MSDSAAAAAAGSTTSITTAEDEKRKKALEAMSSGGTLVDEERVSASNNQDQAALGDAVKDLGGDKGKQQTAGGAGSGGATVKTGKVKISSADVNLIVEQFELSKKKAEEALRKCGGDVGVCLKSLLRGEC